MRVVCVKIGDKYGPEWVYRLRNMVERNLDREHAFVCVTDKPIDDVICLPAAPDLPGWWGKVGLFRPGFLPGDNLYLDLDVVITRNITGMVETNLNRGKVTAPDDFSYSLRFPKSGLGPDTRRLLGGIGTVNSSVMLWHSDDGRDIWERFTADKMNEVHGDQNWITQCMWPAKLALLLGPWVCSYKYHVQRGEPVAPIVVFHGSPKVSDLPKGDPLRQLWTA